jgi:hypothetical protein
MKRVRAMKLCEEDQTCCRVASADEIGVEIYRESIIAGRSVGTRRCIQFRLDAVGHASGCWTVMCGSSVVAETWATGMRNWVIQ